MAFEMPRAKPEEVGLSSARLKRLTGILKADIDTGVVPGAVVLVARHGKIACLEALGYRDREAGAQMATDTIFRIASMTKPFTSVATMMLAEEGKLLIADQAKIGFVNKGGRLKCVTRLLLIHARRRELS